MKTIREKNRLQIFSFILLNYTFISIYYYTIPKEIANYIEWGKTIGIFVFINLFVSLINGLIPRGLKEIIVFWRIKNRLPGFYSFSKYALKDSRISMKDLNIKLGILPSLPKEQNELWYKIYKEFENDSQILEIHRLYVLSRDLASIVIILIGFYFASIIFVKFSIIVLCILLLQYFLLVIISRNYCRQFVVDVLAKK